MGETETVVLIEAVRECAMGLIVDATISPISPFRFFFSSLLRFESGGQSPARIFKRVEIFDLTGLRHWKYPIENAENKCRTLLSVRVGQKCRIILIQLDSRVNAKREIFRRVFFFFNLDWKEAIVTLCIVRARRC